MNGVLEVGGVVMSIAFEGVDSGEEPPSASCLPRNMSVSQTPEDSCELDLVYITERIIAVSFPSTATEENFQSNLREVAQMLKSKHGGNYLVRIGLFP